MGKWREDYFVTVPGRLTTEYKSAFTRGHEPFQRRREDAIAEARKVERYMAILGSPTESMPPLLLKEFVALYAEDMRRLPIPKPYRKTGAHRKSSTVKHLDPTLKAFIDSTRPACGTKLGDLRPDAIVEADIIDYLIQQKDKGRLTSTQIQALSGVRGFFAWMGERGIMPPTWSSPVTKNVVAFDPVVPDLTPPAGFRLVDAVQAAYAYECAYSTILRWRRKGFLSEVAFWNRRYWFHVSEARLDGRIEPRVPCPRTAMHVQLQAALPGRSRLRVLHRACRRARADPACAGSVARLGPAGS